MMNLDFQRELLRRYPRFFRKPALRAAGTNELTEPAQTADPSPHVERLDDPSLEPPMPHIERPGWTVFDERGFECGDGWFDIVDRLARSFEAEIDAMAARGIPKSQWPRIRQCKEKFGSLRFYFSYPGEIPEALQEGVLEAEAESLRTCEFCGENKAVSEEPPQNSLCETCEAMASTWDRQSNAAELNIFERYKGLLRNLLNSRTE